MDKKMNVLFWPGWWYPSRVDELGGIFIEKHAEAVSRFCKVSVLYITADPKLKRAWELDADWERRHAAGAPTLRVYYKPAPRVPLISKLIDAIYYIKAARQGLKVLKEKTGPPDIIHVHVNPPAGLVYLLTTQLKKIPFIFTEHWSGYLPANGSYRGFLRTRLTRFFVKRAAAVTTVSHSLEQAMRGHGLENNYHVVPNVVDTEVFTRLSPKQPVRVQQAAVLHVSGLSPLKNIPGMLRAVRRLADTRTDFQFHIVGDGEYRKTYETLAAELNLLNSVVFFHGKKDTAGVAETMKNADLFLMFSDYENSPCVINEALASGLPVIATNVGGIPEHISKNNGALVEPQDEDGLYKTLNHMLNNLDQYDREKIRKYAVEHFSYPVIGQEFYKLYEKIASGGKGGFFEKPPPLTPRKTFV